MAFQADSPAQMVRRVRVWHGLLVLVLVVFGIRLFYVQVFKYDRYKDAALSDQLKQYQIPATRGIISIHNDGGTVPIVLNQTLYTLYVDPSFVKHPNKYASAVVNVIGGQPSDYLDKLTKKGSRYQILGKKLTAAQSKQILALKYPGLGTQAQSYRTYPDGSLASQLLGFVNSNGLGQYGVEQALNASLAGTPGDLKAITDVHGIPLAASRDNVQKAPVDGDDVTLTINMAMQSQMESILANQAQKTKSKLLSAIIMDPYTGEVKAMANYPTYDPNKLSDIEDASVLTNAAVSNAIEPGSIMKTLTTGAALDQGVITPSTSFYDPAHWLVDKYNITDIEEDGGARVQNVASILALSLNTGATWELMQMSQKGGTSINMKGIDAWHEYMVNHFLFGRTTGIEQGYESAGYVPKNNPDAPAIGLTYANTSFGQGVTTTAIQMASAMSAMLNGGTYYQPTLVDSVTDASGKVTKNHPKVVRKNVVSEQVSQEMQPLMEQVVTHYLSEGFGFMNFPSQYIVGGKTGTAQLEDHGVYSKTEFNGTYLGFVGGDKPQYVICVFNNKPVVGGYAGSWAGQPVFADLAHMLINNGYVSPKS